MQIRKNQADLSDEEWQRLIAALNSLHGVGPAPRYREFVDVHVRAMSMRGMAWSVHSMPGMVGTNFLAWHRHFLLRFEQALQSVDSDVHLPYWDWIGDPELPAPLVGRSLERRWSVTRQWDPSYLPIAGDVAAAAERKRFRPFQRVLEQIHNNVHLAVGGTMAGESSPADPLFFLHHANIDRLWAEWQRAHRAAVPPNERETLKPRPLFGVKVSQLLSTSKLGYRYGT